LRHDEPLGTRSPGPWLQLNRDNAHGNARCRSNSPAAHRRNFALDLPLVAYPTEAEYEQ